MSELLSEGMLSEEREDIVSELAADGIFSSDEVISPLTEEDAHELEAIWNSRKDEFLRGVGMRLSRTLRRDASGQLINE